jgi:uncharacterized protein
MHRTDGHAFPELPTAAPSRRLEVVDALRGFALFGVAVSNVAVFAGTGTIAAEQQSPLDLRMGLLAYHLVTGKFLALFALTFGLSFGLYLRQCDEQAEPVSARYLRRLGSLLLIGAVHHIVFGADILMTYAVLGVVLLLLRNASDRVLLLGAVCSLALPVLWRGLAEWLHYRPPPPVVSRAERVRLAVEGPYFELVRIRAVMLTRSWVEFLQQSVNYVPLFLLGLWADRKKLLDLSERGPLLRAACWGGLSLAVCGYLAQAGLRPLLSRGPSFSIRAAFGIVYHLTTIVQAIGYGAGIALLWSRVGHARRMLRLLVPAGRMALTNYLTISVLVSLVVAATGSYGRLPFAAASACGVLLWLMELVVSTWWLRHHRLGPVEWLWRSMTNGRFQRMRIVSPIAPPS